MHSLLFTHSLAGLSVWLSEPIHDPKAFKFTLTLGFLQMLVAVYGGVLAVMALPEGMPRIPHFVGFFLLGVFLFFVTFYVGLLNDRSQFQATKDTGEIKGELKNNQTALGTALHGLNTLTGAWTAWNVANTGTSSCNTAKASEIADLRRYAQEIVDLAKAQTQSPALANAPTPVLTPTPTTLSQPAYRATPRTLLYAAARS